MIIKIKKVIDNYINKMKSVPYSPFNKTYKYICVQNQVAHSKNKRKVSSSVGSNISFANSTHYSSNMIASLHNSKISCH